MIASTALIETAQEESARVCIFPTPQALSIGRARRPTSRRAGSAPEHDECPLRGCTAHRKEPRACPPSADTFITWGVTGSGPKLHADPLGPTLSGTARALPGLEHCDLPPTAW